MENKKTQIRADTSFLGTLREWTAGFAKELGFSDEALGEIEMAVNEAATNIILHGYPKSADLPDNSKVIEIELKSIKNGIEIILSDNAPYFNPLEFPSPDIEAHLAELKTHGLGVYSMRNFTDGMEYKRREHGGNMLVMRKFKK